MKQESKCKDEAETNKGEGTVSAARDTRVISISSDDNECLDGKVGSHVMGVVTSADSENSGATVVTTEPPKSSPTQTMEPVKPSADVLSGTQWTALSVPTGGVQSAAPQVLDKVPIAGATHGSVLSPYPIPSDLVPSFFLPTNPIASQTPLRLPTQNTKSRLRRALTTRKRRGAVQTAGFRSAMAVPIAGATYLAAFSPYSFHTDLSPTPFHQTNLSVNPMVLSLPTSSTQMTGLTGPYSYTFSGFQQNISPVETNGVEPTVTGVVGSEPTVQTTNSMGNSLRQDNPNSSPLSIPRSLPINPTVMSPASSSRTTVPTSSVEMSMLSNLSNFHVSVTAQSTPKTTEKTVVPNVTCKGPVTCTITRVGGTVTEMKGKTPDAGGTGSSSIKPNDREFMPTKLATLTSQDVKYFYAPAHSTALPKPRHDQTTVPGSNCQQAALSTEATSVGSTTTKREGSAPITEARSHLAQYPHKSYAHCSSVTTPTKDVSLNVTLAMFPTSTMQNTITSSVQNSMLSNMSQFRNSLGAQTRVPKNIAKTVLSRATHEKHLNYSVVSRAKTSGVEGKRVEHSTVSQASLWPSLQFSEVASVQTIQRNLPTWWQVPQSCAVTGTNKFVTQPAEIQPLDLSRSGTRQQPSLQPPGVPPRLQLPPPPASSHYAIPRHMLQSGIPSLPTPQYFTPRIPPRFPERPLLFPRTVAAPRTPKRRHRPTRPSAGSAVTLQISAANVDRTPPYGMVTQPNDARQSVIVRVPRTAAATTKCNNQTEVSPTSIPSVSVDALSASSAPDPPGTDRGTHPGAH
ncbi:mucin-5B-like [Schistocerca cancellata]|uniref:mucin-5B-like n=1 Tax=Schistocerca cancellata TaxID=274614 RepID=UPI00211730D6|nr:mucin-5B-like [Schistocerca cancellata]